MRSPKLPPITEAVAFAIGRSQGYSSLPVMRRNFQKAAESVLQAVIANLEPRLQHDEEGVIEMLRGGKGPLE